uniref:Uncharacterized protein n=1 Tax=Arundo donax TaxID=35708 RepID=A0A0A9BJY1_ARUDO
MVHIKGPQNQNQNQNQMHRKSQETKRSTPRLSNSPILVIDSGSDNFQKILQKRNRLTTTRP